MTTKNTKKGQERLKWANKKAKELSIPTDGQYLSTVVFEVHPTKRTVCQICGEEMSIKYIYPNRHLINFLNKNYSYPHNVFDTIYDINEYLSSENLTDNQIKEIYIQRMGLDININEYSLDELVNLIELYCRNGDKKTFGPGAMSNFPDRYDGFHSYNRCCRSTEDKGRSAANLRSYGKDRRAYEYWSDGNIHAANQYMTSPRFKNMSADHIGPVSLGFIHDPRFIQPMSGGDNSAKRDRIFENDFNKLVDLEEKLNICPTSWFAEKIWGELKQQYNLGILDFEKARVCLGVNITYYMEILWYILELPDDKGEEFLISSILEPKQSVFNYNYKFDEHGNIIERTNRNITDSTRKEFGRFIRVSFDSIYDFKEKENRNIKVELHLSQIGLLDKLLAEIKKNPESKDALSLFERLIYEIQDYLIKIHL